MTAALKLSEPVLLPATLGIFLVVVAWPIQDWLERYVWRWLATVVTTLIVLLVIGLMIYGIIWSMQKLTERAPELAQRFERLYAEVMQWARLHSVPIPEEGGSSAMTERLTPIATAMLRETYSALTIVGFALAFFILGLLEVREIAARAQRGFRREVASSIVRTGREIAFQFRQYLVAIIATSAVGGLATGLFCLAMGVDLALLWGLVSGLLNLVPTVGPAISVVPPTLFAILQFDGIARPAIVFVGLGFLQFFIGNFVDPKIGGRVLALSPWLILFAVVLWGWIWGSLGAIIAMPLVAAIVVTCRQFESTRWIATLVGQGKHEEGGRRREEGGRRSEEGGGRE